VYLCLFKCERRNGSVYVERLGYVYRGRNGYVHVERLGVCGGRDRGCVFVKTGVEMGCVSKEYNVLSSRNKLCVCVWRDRGMSMLRDGVV